MLDLITQLLDAEVDYIGLLTGVFLYIAVMWLMFCGWVFIDARKKFKSVLVATLFTLFVLPLNIPGFILYLIVRPEHEEWSDIAVLDNEGHQHHLGGVQVPIVHFTGDEGEVQMTFGLSINPKQITSTSPDMNIDVSWDSDSDSMQLKKDSAVQKATPVTDSTRMTDSTSTVIAGLGSRFKKSLSSVGSVVNKSINSSTQQLEVEGEEPKKEDIKEKKDVEDRVVSQDDKSKSKSKAEENNSSKKNKKSNKKKGKKK